MFAVMFELDASGWRRSLAKLPEALDQYVGEVVHRSARVIAESARQVHEFRNRTGDLERSIRAERPHGRFMRDTLGTEVVATMHYASYVEQGTSRMRSRPYLLPAMRRLDLSMGEWLQEGVDAAVRSAGL